MNSAQNAGGELAALAHHLASRREAILDAWRQAVEADPELTTAPALSRTQFYDHIPAVLDAFERRLRARGGEERAAAEAAQKESAAGHGLLRWQHGYHQREVMFEWRHLHLLLVDELEIYCSSQSGLDPGAMSFARRALAELCSEGVCESATQVARLQQAEAAGRVRDLEHALQELRALERRRAEAWREAAHDLRGNLGVVSNVAAVLNFDDVTAGERAQFTQALQRSVVAQKSLLNDLMDLARLEAGHEQRRVEPFDVAALLGELCASMQPLAKERGLSLRTQGPPELRVEGDAVKARRIAQNLLSNALKYTERGGVRLTWEQAAGEHWVLCVQDTGPGFEDGSVTPIAQALKEATEEAREVEVRALEEHEEALEPSAQAEPAPTLTSQSAHRPAYEPPGEGIGLSIVKRLCELLDASLELETRPGQGSTFRVVFPGRYETP